MVSISIFEIIVLAKIAKKHTLMFKDGKATYTNQYIPSPRFQIEQELDEEYFPTIGEYFGLIGLIKVLLGKHLVKAKIEDDKMVRWCFL